MVVDLSHSPPTSLHSLCVGTPCVGTPCVGTQALTTSWCSCYDPFLLCFACHQHVIPTTVCVNKESFNYVQYPSERCDDTQEPPGSCGQCLARVNALRHIRTTGNRTLQMLTLHETFHSNYVHCQHQATTHELVHMRLCKTVRISQPDIDR